MRIASAADLQRMKQPLYLETPLEWYEILTVLKRSKSWRGFMQEVFEPRKWTTFKCGHTAPFQYMSHKLDGGGGTYDGGVVLISKYPICWTGATCLWQLSGNRCAADKGVLCKIIKDSRPYHLFFLHLWLLEFPRTSKYTNAAGRWYSPLADVAWFTRRTSLLSSVVISICKLRFPLDFTPC